MKKYLFAAVTALLVSSSITYAQEDKNSSEESAKPKKLGEYDEIIIKKKQDGVNKDKKIVIEITDNNITVNGKPIDDFKDDELAVIKRDALRFKFSGPSSPFRQDGGAWSYDSDYGGEAKPFLGVMTEGSASGTKILTISENSAAAKAGLKKEDVITKVNDKEVFDHEQLTELIGSYKPGDKINITYTRNGKTGNTTATLGKRAPAVIGYKGAPGAPFPPDAPYPPEAHVAPIPPIAGMPHNFQFDFDHPEGFRKLFSGEAKPRLGIKIQDTEEGKGVKVLDVEEGSVAEKAGIRKDDVITSFEGKDVNSAEELAKASKEAKEKTALKVQLKRNGKTQHVEVKIPKKLKTTTL